MDYFELGQVLKSQGIKGEVKLRPYTDDLERFGALCHVYLKKGGAYQKHSVQRARVYKEFAFLKIEGIDDRNAAEELRGQSIYIDREHAAPLPEGAYYIADLIGLRVEEEGGEVVGVVEDIIKIAGGMDVYQVKTEKGNILFPAAPGVIVQKDIQAGRMVVDKKRLNEVCVDG